jgi:hypothetical protein
MNIRGSVLYFILFFAMNNQYCLCNRCNGTVKKTLETQRRHMHTFGLSTVLPNPPDDEMGGDGDDEGAEDEEIAREREIREGLLRELLEGGSDDEMFSPSRTPPMSETGDDDLEEEERPPARIDGGYVGIDDAMDEDTGLVAERLDEDNVRHQMVDWLAGAATAATACLLELVASIRSLRRSFVRLYDGVAY